MALDRDQVGLLFNIDVNSMDARQQLELFQGVVQGMASEVRDQFSRMNTQLATTTRETGKLAQSFGDAASNQLRGFLGQFGLIGDAAGDMIPALSGTSAAIVGLTGVTVAAGAALAATAVKAMDYTGKIDDLAQVTNLTTETIQSLQLAATLSGQSFEDVSQTAIIFQKRIEEAKKGNAELMATFKALGVDLNGPVDQAFRQTLERLNDLEDGSLKTSVSLDLFGKSGSKLLPVMDQVGGSFDGLISRARELGIVLSEEDIAKSNQFADQLDILSLKMKGLANDVGVGLINMLNDLGDAFVEAFDPAAAERMQATLNEMQNKARQEGTIDPALRARLEGIDTGANAPNALQLALEEARRKPAAGRTGGAAAQLVNLPSGDAVKRTYESFRQAIIAEERATQAQREKLRIDAIQGEEAKLRDALIRQDEAIAKARADAAAGARTSRAGVLQQVVVNLEAEKALTMQAIDEIETARVQAMMRFAEAANAQTADRLANELNAEEEYLDNWAQAYEDALARIDEQIRASAARRRAEQEADPSSPLNIFGPAGQAAADRGAGIFGQLGASASEALSIVSQQMGSFGTMMQDMFSNIANGLQNVIQGFIMTGRIGGQAFKALAASIISSVVAQSAVKAIFELAEGFAASARYDYASATQHFTAAKFYGVVAGVAAAAAVGLAAIGPGGGGGSGQFLAQDRGGGGTMIREQGGRRSSEPQVIIIRAETEPGVMVSKVIQDYRNNGEMRSTLRRDLLGEF